MLGHAPYTGPEFLILCMSTSKVPYTFSVTREWAFFLCVKRELGFIFSLVREPIFFYPRKLVFHFFVIREICINLRVICEPTTFAGINFHFFGDFSVIKVRKLHQTTICKTCLFDALADGGLRTNHSDSEAGGPRI